MTESKKTAGGRHSTFLERMAWGAGGMTEGLSQSIFTFAFSIFGIGLGVSPFLIGIAKGLPRLVDGITDPFMGNISDNTHTRRGRRREAMFSAVYQWIWKCGATLAIILSGALLSLVGAKVNTPNMILAPQVVLNMRLIMAVVPTVLGILAFLCLWFFPLSEKRLEEVKKELARRKELLVS
jgi:Na+/melibiose symporter-like transporter